MFSKEDLQHAENLAKLLQKAEFNNLKVQELIIAAHTFAWFGGVLKKIQSQVEQSEAAKEAATKPLSVSESKPPIKKSQNKNK
jgi:hypothetical protein